jgi:hypothetical protein
MAHIGMEKFDRFRKKKPLMQFPPIPDWQPSISQPLDRIVDRLKYYTNGACDIAVFKNGTCVVFDDGLSDEDAEQFAKEVLAKIFNYHPDMNPTNMDDGNILVRYNHPAVNIVLSDFPKSIGQKLIPIIREHWPQTKSLLLPKARTYLMI